MFHLDLSYATDKINYASYKNKINEYKEWLKSESCKSMLGWLHWASSVKEKELIKIREKAAFIRENFDTLVIVGVGGSYLGARCVIEAINGLFPLDKMEIVYLGNTMSARYTSQVLQYLKNKNFAVAVISKSGKTLEPALAFRLLKNMLYQKLGNKYKRAIISITDESSGSLRRETNNAGYASFVIPKDIGGRYSVITPVGLFPLAVAGVDIDNFLAGVRQAEIDFDNSNQDNPCFLYAITRHELEKASKPVELFVSYEPQLHSFCEWLKQLFGESEGKDGKGVLPISANYTADLHSFGQFIQDGTHILFETVIKVETTDYDVLIPSDKNNFDNLNKLAGKGLNYINSVMQNSVLKAHNDGGVPNIVLNISSLDEFHIGYLIYFFMKACTFSCFLNNVNPFNQPGVEVYKKNARSVLKID